MTVASIRRELPPAGVVATLGPLQILSWGSTFYLLGVLGHPIAGDTGWPFSGVVAGLSIALLVAGFVSPFVGRRIAAIGGRLVLAAGATLIALGLAAIAVAPNLPVYLAAWAVIGCGMAAGLYDPTFSTLGQLYGRDARGLITAVTLFGGFASSVSWPTTAFLLDHLGWRLTCAAYAALEIGVAAPAYLLLIPQRSGTARPTDAPTEIVLPDLPPERQRFALILLGTILTVSAAFLSLISTHLLTLLQARGMTLASAVGLGALVGPGQVAARVLQIFLGRRRHPTLILCGGTILVAASLVLLWGGWPVTAAALIAFGMGNGISSIIRGTAPLVLFGPARYPEVIGKLGLPIFVAMALTPVAAVPLVHHGPAATFAVTAVVAVINVGLAALLVAFVTTHNQTAQVSAAR